MNAWRRWEGGDLLLAMRVQLRACRNEIAGPLGYELKVRITAAPVDGQANVQLVALLAKSFGVPKKAVLLLGGDSGRSKRLRVRKPRRLPKILGPTCTCPSNLQVST